MNAEVIGKRILFYSFAITCALVISLQLLQATTVQQEYVVAEKSLEIDDPDAGFFPGQIIQSTREILGVKADQKPLNDPEVQIKVAALPGAGKPVAYLLSEKLYGIDKRCQLLGLADSLEFADLPVISASNPLVQLDNLKICDPQVRKATSLVMAISKKNPTLAAGLSEIAVDEELGLIGYFGWGGGIFVIFGKETLGEKLRKLNLFYAELGETRLMELTRSLDLRYGDRIIVKKKRV